MKKNTRSSVCWFVSVGLMIGSGLSIDLYPSLSKASTVQEADEQKAHHMIFKEQLTHLERIMKNIHEHDEEQVNACMDLIAQMVNDRVDATVQDVSSFKILLGNAQKSFKNMSHVYEQLADALKQVEEPVSFADRYDLVQDMIDDEVLTHEEQDLLLCRLRALVTDMVLATPEERKDFTLFVMDFIETIESDRAQKNFAHALGKVKAHLKEELKKHDIPLLLDTHLSAFQEMIRGSLPKGALFNFILLNVALGQTFFIRASHDNKLKADGVTSLALDAQFDLINYPDGTLSLRNKVKNNYVQCNKEQVCLAAVDDQPNQRFVGSGTLDDFSLQVCSDKKYLSVAEDGTLITVSVKGAREHFKIIPLTPYQGALSQNRLRDDASRIHGYVQQLVIQAKTPLERELLVRDMSSFIEEKQAHKKIWKAFKANSGLCNDIVRFVEVLRTKEDYKPVDALLSHIKKNLSDEKIFPEETPKTYKGRITVLNNQMKALLKADSKYTQKESFIGEAHVLVNDRSDGSIDDLALFKTLLVHAKEKLFSSPDDEPFKIKIEALLSELHTSVSFEERVARFKNTVDSCCDSDSGHALAVVQMAAFIRDSEVLSVVERQTLEMYIHEMHEKMRGNKLLESLFQDIQKLEDVLKKGKGHDA